MKTRPVFEFKETKLSIIELYGRGITKVQCGTQYPQPQMNNLK